MKQDININELEQEYIKIWKENKEMINYCIKADFHIKINNFFVKFENKPIIKKNIYYDDERPRPQINLETFINYNMKYNFNNKIRHLNFDEDLYFINNYNQTDKIKYVANIKLYDLETGRFKQKNLIKLDNEQINIIKQVVEQLKEDYLKRLNTYWKKYQNKIYAIGYWANR